MTVQDSWTLDSMVDAYKQYQRRVRGLRARTLYGYEAFLRSAQSPEWLAHEVARQKSRCSYAVRNSLDTNRNSSMNVSLPVISILRNSFCAKWPITFS